MRENNVTPGTKSRNNKEGKKYWRGERNLRCRGARKGKERSNCAYREASGGIHVGRRGGKALTRRNPPKEGRGLGKRQ